MVFNIDDLAINDSSGSFHNSWPGAGRISHLKPNAAGDNSDWTNDYQNVDEVTPDDSGTIVSSNTSNHIDDHNIEAPDSMGTNDTINVVQVGVRFNGAGASANASFVLRIKASASGTVEESSAITPSNTTYVTNAAAAPRNYSLTLYDLPGASTTAWTKADLTAAQIGYRLSSTSTNAAQISTVWLLVDYTPHADRIQVINTSRAQADNTSPVTWTHVHPTGYSNTMLVVTVQTEDNASGGDRPVTAITYNGDALTKVRSDDTGVGTNDTSEIWYLLNPDTGSNTVSVTTTAATEGLIAQAISVANAAQSGQPDTSTGSTANSGTVSTSITPGTNNTLIIDSTVGSGSTNVLTPSSGQEVISIEQNSGQMYGASSHKYVGTAAATTIQYTLTSSQWVQTIAAFKEYVAGGGGSPQPANALFLSRGF